MTQFGRALHTLNIKIIRADSSQAKGCIERADKTPVKTVAKGLRLAGQRFPVGFIADYNARFVKPRRSLTVYFWRGGFGQKL